MRTNKGISLIVLVITIIVIIILAGAVLLTLSNNNPVESARKATFLSDRANLQNALTLYIANQLDNTTNYTTDEVLSTIGTEAGGLIPMDSTFMTTYLGVTPSYGGDFYIDATSGVVKYDLAAGDTAAFWADGDVTPFLVP